MRIIAGEFGSRRIEAPPGRTSRPTTDRVREALFSMLSPVLAGAAVLDLFAGSGALSLEAVSRGARLALLCDTDGAACAAVARNIGSLGVEDRVICQKRDAFSLARELCAQGRRFDVIFLDPPYKARMLGEALELCAPLLSLGGRIAAETDAAFEPEPPPPLRRIVSRKYGDTRICIFARKDEETE